MQRCLELNTPLLEEYDYRSDDSAPPLRIAAKPEVELRGYQVSR